MTNFAICKSVNETKVLARGGSVIYSRWVFSTVCFDQLLMHYSPSSVCSWLSLFHNVAKVRSFIRHAVHKSIAKLGLPDITFPGEYRMMNGFPQMRPKSRHMFDECVSLWLYIQYNSVSSLNHTLKCWWRGQGTRDDTVDETYRQEIKMYLI